MVTANEALADAWEAGFQKGVEFGDWVSDLDSEKPDFTNPFRGAL